MSDVYEDVAKRRADRRKKIRRRRLIISLIFLLVIAIIVLAIMCLTIFFPVLNVKASGSALYTSQDIIKASGITEETNMFTVSEKQVEQKIRVTLPYVDDVQLKRQLPDTIILDITDAEEYACVSCDGVYYVISDSGYVLNHYDEIPVNTFEIITSGVICELGKPIVYENAREAKLAQKIIDLISDSEIKLNSVDVTNTVSLTARVEDRFNVKFGTEDNLDKKVLHLGGMIKSIGDRSGEINLSMWSQSQSEGSFVPEN